MIKRILLSLILTTVASGQGYEPFLIAPFQTAKFIGMEPWQSPTDAFPTLINARVNKGVLEKRQGYQLFATMKHDAVVQTDTTIMGIETYLSNGLPQLLIFDTLRVNKYDPVDLSMSDITGGSDLFSGSNADFFHSVNWLGKMYFTNNVNQIYQYTGSGNVSAFNIQVDSDPDLNHVSTARFVFVKNDRLLLLDTVEHGDWISQRCRFSPTLSFDFSQPGSGFIDAPTEERMSSAGEVGQDIVVFFQGRHGGSIWKLRTSRSLNLPFQWDKITTVDTSYAPYSAVEFNGGGRDGISVIGLNNILWYDGFQVRNLDLQRIRDIVDDFDATKIRLSTSHNVIEDQHIFYTYTSSGGSVPDKVLDYNIIEQSWSVYDLPAHVFGTWSDQAVPIWTKADDIFVSDGALMSQMTLDSRAILNDPFPFTLMGSTDSKIYKVQTGDFDGTDDASGTIAMDVRSARWNPFIKENKEATFGRIAFLVDNDSNASFVVSFYRNSRSTPDSPTRTISCDSSDDGADKFWVSTNAGATSGDFHSIQISHDERNNRPRIHAIMLWMRPGGRLNF